MFFRRLEIYIELPPTTEMVDMIVQIMVEVLSILGIATKEIKKSRISKYFLQNMTSVDWTMIRKICEEAVRKN